MNVTVEDFTRDLKGKTILIGGVYHEARDGQEVPVVDPSTGRTFSSLARGKSAEVDQAVVTARQVYEEVWSKLAPVERGRILFRFAELIDQHRETLTEIECQDVGKPISQARADIIATARYAEFYAGAPDKLHGETIPYESGYTAFTLREPFGVTAHIIPWNYPAQTFGRSVIASLAAGNTAVVKPGEEACLSVLYLANLALEAGLPPGALNIVTGYGIEAGAALAAHPGVDHISFTGSPETGAIVQSAAARYNRPTTMELGGKSPQIVFADADLDLALPTIYNAIIQNCGQTCSAGSRLLIESSIFEELTTALAQYFENTEVGPAVDDPDCGPLISAAQLERVEGYRREAEEAGIATIATASTPPIGGGFFTSPTLLGPVGRNDPRAQEEIFGPILVAITFDDEENAIEIANGTDYGLVAGIWTRDGARQLRIARRLRVGQIFTNCYGAGGGVELPFGGFKRSGYGREKGIEGLKSFTQLKTITIFHG